MDESPNPQGNFQRDRYKYKTPAQQVEDFIAAIQTLTYPPGPPEHPIPEEWFS